MESSCIEWFEEQILLLQVSFDLVPNVSMAKAGRGEHAFCLIITSCRKLSACTLHPLQAATRSNLARCERAKKQTSKLPREIGETKPIVKTILLTHEKVSLQLLTVLTATSGENKRSSNFIDIFFTSSRSARYFFI